MKYKTVIFPLILTVIFCSFTAQASQQGDSTLQRVSRYTQVLLDAYGPVAKGETLWQIVTSIYSNRLSTNKAMVMLFNLNRGAFEHNNINCLKVEALLVFPVSAQATILSPQEATQQVRDHHQQWAGMQRRCSQ